MYTLSFTHSIVVSWFESQRAFWRSYQKSCVRYHLCTRLVCFVFQWSHTTINQATKTRWSLHDMLHDFKFQIQADQRWMWWRRWYYYQWAAFKIKRLLNVPGCSVQAASKFLASSMQYPGLVLVRDFLNSIIYLHLRRSKGGAPYSGRLSLFSWFAGYPRAKVPSVTPFYVPQAFFLMKLYSYGSNFLICKWAAGLFAMFWNTLISTNFNLQGQADFVLI